MEVGVLRAELIERDHDRMNEPTQRAAELDHLYVNAST